MNQSWYFIINTLSGTNKILYKILHEVFDEVL